jgi:hypothetical protein
LPGDHVFECGLSGLNTIVHSCLSGFVANKYRGELKC